MVDILNNPISHLVIGEEWLVKLINHLESNIGDNTKSSTSNASEFKSLFRYIEKIIAIFEEIESDLIHTENKIQETRKIVYTLAHQFGRIGRFCLSEIPNVVQKEHDQASNNLTALRWNIKKTQEEYNKISTRLKSLTATKKSIESEISQLTGCTSLVNEKSLITEAELKEIIDRTIEVTETLAKMNAKLNETQIHYNAVKRKSEEIRTNLALDVSKAEQNLIDAQNKLKNVIEIEPKLIEETVNMKNKIESLKLHIQTLSNTVKDYQQTFNQLKQQLIELNKNYTNQQILSENLFQWIKENEENLINQFNGKLINEINQLNQLLHNKSEKYYQIKMNEIELQTENDRCEKRILDYQNEIAKYRKSIELLESRLTTAQDLLQVGNADYSRTQAKHLSLTDDLELTKSRIKAEQEEKQSTLKYLQHKIEEEYGIKSKLMRDLENSFKEFEELQQTGYQKRLQLDAVAKQSESNVENIKLELDAIRLNHNYYSEQLSSIQNEYNQFQSEWNQEYAANCNKIQTLDDSVMKSKMQFNELNTRLKEMTTEKNFLQEKHNKLHLSLLALMKVRLRGTIKLSQLRCTIADLTKTNKSLNAEINILRKQNEQIDQLNITRQLQQTNLMKSRDLILKNLKEELKEKLSLNLSISEQYIKMQGEQSKLLSLFYLAVTNSMLDQNQLFNAEQISALWARILRQRNYWELKLQAKQETLVNNLLSQNHCINQQIDEVKRMHIKP
ncbi:spindle assembly checkpoint component MAD1 (Mitotic arrest deficient 1), partial [Schistosoma japonicum]